MAEKTIGLKIQLNGLNAVVKDIQTFETEIRTFWSSKKIFAE